MSVFRRNQRRWCTAIIDIQFLRPEEVGHASNCIMGQYYNMFQFTRAISHAVRASE